MHPLILLAKLALVRGIKELDPKKFGIIVKKTTPISYPNGTDVVFNGHLPLKFGLLLPDLEGVDTIEKQISIAYPVVNRRFYYGACPVVKRSLYFGACQKGGIDPSREKILIYRFDIEKYQ